VFAKNSSVFAENVLAFAENISDLSVCQEVLGGILNALKRHILSNGYLTKNKNNKAKTKPLEQLRAGG
jgi:hypothetical protein